MTLTHANNQFARSIDDVLGAGASVLLDLIGGLTVAGAVTAGGGITLQTPALAINALLNAGSGNVADQHDVGRGYHADRRHPGNMIVASAGDVDLKTKNTNSVSLCDGGRHERRSFLLLQQPWGRSDGLQDRRQTGGPGRVWEQSGNLTVDGAANSNGTNVGL